MEPDLKNICELRDGGTPIHFPWELDYYCPICHAKCKVCSGEKIIHKIHIDNSLHYSEYKYFMWCEKCKIDIPSMLCLRANTKDKVEWYTERFLEMIKEIRNNKNE